MLNHRKTRRRTLCPVSEKSLLKDIEKDEKLKKIEVIHGYIQHHRLIPQTLYCKLKALRVCQNCGKEIHYPPEIHHKIPVRRGGQSIESNLLALCKSCHLIFDDMERENENQTRTRI